ncbi:hypothetical protein GCM10027176_40960 [Actinoallomurus bryophytorum]|uniref:N-acetyltransferase domain-containing protein n=1 Tax=Actinoallomurus bryophytorum TaxID=1490222 RepID=A0A543C1I7_9ACTN|nr:hypothetical protein [Actinoallomurus bryophytorum]TQL90940.1 hypothetical protein FB559_8259 [Actinoallomurus bryophytorum]
MTGRSPQTGAFRDVIKVDHGPVDLLQRFFAWADSETRRRGVVVSFARLEELLNVNSANAATWRSLVPIFRPELGGITTETGFALLGRNAAGDVVAAQAARFYDWRTTNLRTQAASLKMFYADPESARGRGDMCEITAPIADRISGRVAFSGGGWYRPDYRGKGLGRIIPRISRAWAFARWRTDFTISMMEGAVLDGGFAERVGYTNVEPDAIRFRASPTGAARCALVWMESKQMLADLEAISS